MMITSNSLVYAPGAILKVRQTTLLPNDDYIKLICIHQVNSSGSEVCKERFIWPACLPRSEILSDMAYIILSDCQIWHLLDCQIVRYGIYKNAVTNQVRNTYSYGSLHVIFTNSSYVYSTSANLRTTPSLQQLFSQGGAESQRGDHGLRRYFLFCQFYVFNSYASKFFELIYSFQLRKIRIPIVSDTECDRYSGLHLKVTTGEHVFFSVACSN